MSKEEKAVKLTKTQMRALHAMTKIHDGITYYDAARVGASGRTLSILVARQFAVKKENAGYPGNLWLITPAGRAALAEMQP